MGIFYLYTMDWTRWDLWAGLRNFAGGLGRAEAVTKGSAEVTARHSRSALVPFGHGCDWLSVLVLPSARVSPAYRFKPARPHSYTAAIEVPA